MADDIKKSEDDKKVKLTIGCMGSGNNLIREIVRHILDEEKQKDMSANNKEIR